MSDAAQRQRERYAKDPEYRKRKRASNNASRTRNKDKINARRRLRYATDPDYRERHHRWGRENKLKARYGITLQEYDSLFAKQKGRCFICRKKSRRRLHVDHCHRKHVIRRLLCGRCNTGMGCFRDDLRLVRRVVAYLVAELKLQRSGRAKRIPKAARGAKR
jgi:Recombination endonuclease VII